jgi:type I restriction enzyme, S subunit
LAAEWPTLSLREANVALIDCDHRTPPASAAGYPYVAIPQLRSGRLDLSDVRRITREHFVEWTRKASPSANDVVLSRRCNPGETAFVPPGLEFALGQNLVLLRADGTKVHPPFLRWLVRGPGWWEQINKFLNVGAVFDSLRCADVPNFELLVPPMAEQRAIADILGALDDKIELNRRMNEALEATARALFKSWFVDFDPVRAKAEGRDSGLAKSLDALFPDSLNSSELGEIPFGWQTATLGDHFEAVRGVSYTGEYLADRGMPLHNLNSIFEGGGYKYEGLKHYNGEYATRHMVEPGDVIVANTEQGHDRLLIGYAALIPRLFERGIASHHVYRLRPKGGSTLTPSFLCHLLNSPHMHDVVSGYANGTTVNMLPLAGIQQPRLAIPPPSLVSTFSDLAIRVESRRDDIVVESRTLAALRDTLLPKLISGELQVKAAERIVADAV